MIFDCCAPSKQTSGPKYESIITIRVIHNNEIPKDFPRDPDLESEFKQDIDLGISAMDCFTDIPYGAPPASIITTIETKEIN